MPIAASLARRATDVAEGLVAVAAWAALSRAAALFEVQPGLTFFFPAAAVTVVAGARLGWLGVVAATVANFVLPWGAASDPWRQAAFAMPTALWAGVVVAARRPAGPTTLRVKRFLTFGVAGGALLAAVSGAALLAVFEGPATWASFSRQAVLWWVSDVTPALVLGLPAIILLAPAVLVDDDDLTAWREWRTRSGDVRRTVAFGIGGAALLFLVASPLAAEVHWFVVLLLPAIVAASVGGGVAAGLVATGAMGSVYLAYVLATLAPSAGDLVVVLSATYANLCLFVAFAIIAGVLSGRNRQLAEHVRRQGEILTRGLEDTVEALAAAMQARIGNDREHLERVARLAVLAGREMGLSADELANLRRAAILHDIGKIGVPEAILNKGAELDVGERALLDRHVELGVDILQRVEFLHPVLALVRCHRERWDGSSDGPHAGRFGLRGEKIPLGSRIIAAVEAFDAISHERPHRRAKGRNAAIAELWRCSGTQFDPEVVATLTRIVSQERDLAIGEPRLVNRS